MQKKNNHSLIVSSTKRAKKSKQAHNAGKGIQEHVQGVPSSLEQVKKKNKKRTGSQQCNETKFML